QKDRAMAKERYKVAKREAKIEVAQAKDKAYKDLYKKLDSKEGANNIYMIAKSRKRKRRDLGNIRPEGSVEVENSSQPLQFECYYSGINQGEVKAALQKMGRNKAVGPDQIPTEAWRLKKTKKKDKIGSKPDKNGKRGEAGKSQKQLQLKEEEKK
nr:retrovirus-related Pol polyprotein LINE-1 [Tanacetum cinerariifolium]